MSDDPWLARVYERTGATVARWPAWMREILDRERRPSVSEQLRLCPCGLPAQSFTTESANGVVRYAIGCNDPLCQWTAGEFATEAAAIAAWNRRSTPKPAPEALHGYWHVEPIQPGDPCEECKPTNRCPIQNPCPVKQIWLEGKEGKQ